MVYFFFALVIDSLTLRSGVTITESVDKSSRLFCGTFDRTAVNCGVRPELFRSVTIASASGVKSAVKVACSFASSNAHKIISLTNTQRVWGENAGCSS